MSEKRIFFKKNPRKKMGGFTLAETMVAVGFISFLSLAIFSTVIASHNILRMQTLNAGINQGGMQLLRSIEREILESSPVADQSHLILSTDADENSVITFQVPVDWDLDGDVVQNALTQTVEWGAYRFVRTTEAQSWLNGWVRYRTVNGQLLREILESANGAILATDIIIPSDVQAFQINPISAKRFEILLTIGKQDTVGRKGAFVRTYRTTFNGNVLVRNGG